MTHDVRFATGSISSFEFFISEQGDPRYTQYHAPYHRIGSYARPKLLIACKTLNGKLLFQTSRLHVEPLMEQKTLSKIFPIRFAGTRL